LSGSSKSFRYHPTEPRIDASLSSPAFQTLGTDTGVHPAVEVCR
jgi:hypothetical protein